VGMYDYASLACGATLTGAEMLLAGDVDVAFNPSGGYHHAGPGYASGFCYLNDVVLGCLAFADAGRRVVFLDIDVHHGDGVQNAFYDRADVMTISLHQDGKTIFPGTGSEDEIGQGNGRGFCANIPLPKGTYDEAYLRVFRTLVIPLIRAYNPDAIVLEIGMDTLSGDPLAQLSMTNNAPADVVGLVMDLGKPVLATGGGGYHPQNTARGWALAWSVLCGEDDADDFATGLGGVMLESTEWQGGLRDRVLVADDRQRAIVEPAIDESIRRVRENLFPLHGL
jgi:acetoin utilization protein AcuC